MDKADKNTHVQQLQKSHHQEKGSKLKNPSEYPTQAKAKENATTSNRNESRKWNSCRHNQSQNQRRN